MAYMLSFPGFNDCITVMCCNITQVVIVLIFCDGTIPYCLNRATWSNIYIYFFFSPSPGIYDVLLSRFQKY